MTPEKNNDGVLRYLWKHLQAFLQKVSLSLDLFIKNELFNHAGAATFFFFLSIPPALLLVLFAFDRFLFSYPEASAVFFDFLKDINKNLDRELLVKIGLLNLNTAAVGIFGLFNLLWAGRAILTSIQRGLSVIFPGRTSRPPLIENIFSLFILTVLLVASFLITFTSIGFNIVQNLLVDNFIIQAFFHSLLPIMRRFLPFMLILVLIFLAYRVVPEKRPNTLSSLVSAVACALSISLLHVLFSKFFTLARYNMVYGVLGTLILISIWVYFSFILFFFFAEFTFVLDKSDILVLERMFLFRFRRPKNDKKVQRFLFKHPARIFDKYSKRCGTGETLFREGEKSTDIYFVDQGAIDIMRRVDGAEKKIAAIPTGRVFGEMAYLLGEPRNASAVSNGESVVFVIIPEIFEELLKVNPEFSRDVIDVLCNRLRRSQFDGKP